MNSYINAIQDPTKINSIPPSSVKNTGGENKKFANILKEAVADVNEAKVASNKQTEAMATGQVEDLHNVMISAQKASITLETSVQIQKKVIDAYNEIMRMQV